MPIVGIPRNGPPEAMRCPVLLCDACGDRIHASESRRDPEVERRGLAVSWDRHVDGDGPAQERLESSPMFFVHQGQCDRAFKKYAGQFYRLADGWSNAWDDADRVLAQLGHNMTHPFEDDPELETEQVLYYPPARIVHLLPSDGYVIKPRWLVGDAE